MSRARIVNLANPVNRQADLNRGLVAWYLALPGLDGGKYFYDLMGLNHGALTSSPIWTSAYGRPGGFGMLSFDGSDDYVDCGMQTIANNTISIGLWFWYRSAASAVNNRIISIEGGPELWTEGSAGINLHNLGVVKGGSNILQNLFGGNIPHDQWAFFAYSTTGSTHAGYIWTPDGVKQSGSSGTVTTWSSGTLRIGRGSSFAEYTPGYYDSVMVFNRTLTEGEWYAIFRESLRGYPNELNYLPISDVHTFRYLRNYYYPLQDSLSKYLVLHQYE